MPLVLLPVLYGALGLPTRSTVLCVVASLGELVLMARYDPSIAPSTGGLVMLGALFVSVGALAITYARYRTRLREGERVFFDKLDRLSSIDELTGCSNYRAFQQRLQGGNRPVTALLDAAQPPRCRCGPVQVVQRRLRTPAR